MGHNLVTEMVMAQETGEATQSKDEEVEPAETQEELPRKKETWFGENAVTNEECEQDADESDIPEQSVPIKAK